MRLENYLSSDIIIFESISSIDDIPSKNKNGTCYQEAMDYMIIHPLNKKLLLCHGLVTGQGAIEGIVYTHAWVEEGNRVIDETMSLKIDKGLYYSIGNINKKNVYSYTRQQMSENVRKFKTYGPWERKLINNKY